MAGGIGKTSAVLFDLDGVLVDSRANMECAWHEVCRRLNIGIAFERYFEQIGRPFPDIMRLLGLEQVGEDAAAVYSSASAANLHLIRIYPGVREALGCLAEKQVPMGIVTSKDAKRTAMMLANFTVNFATVQTPNGILRGKPEPDYLLAGAERMGLSPSSCCYVGDMVVDQTAAARAGMRYLHAGWGYGTPIDGVAGTELLQSPEQLVVAVLGAQA